MTTTLHIILEEMLAPTPTGVARYTRELTRAVIENTPPGCAVAGYVAASTEEQYASVLESLPGLASLGKSPLARRELHAAWQHGFTRLPGVAMLHAPSMLAPLWRHDRLNSHEQVVVTIHDTIAWSHPDSLNPRTAAWQRAMGKRVQKYADAVVVPSHAVAGELEQYLELGDRIRVIGGAPPPSLVVPVDSADRARALQLPERYLVAVLGAAQHKGAADLFAAVASLDTHVSTVVVAAVDEHDALSRMATEAGLSAERLLLLPVLDDADLATVIGLAIALVAPSIAEGFGFTVLEAMQLGTAVIHSDVAALVELTAGEAIVVERADTGFAARLADAISGVIDNESLAAEYATRGHDRAGAFNWSSSAEKIWQLHASL